MGITAEKHASKEMKKAAIYSPYLETLGGGERYMLSIAKVLADNGWVVEVETTNSAILSQAEKLFNLKLTNVHPVHSIKRGDGYDLCVWLSDGSIPTLFARKNILHFQRPFSDVEGKSLINRAKFFRINNVIVNSGFTKKWIDREFPKESIVLYPPVDVKKFKGKTKEQTICYIGRFSQLEQSKRQDVLIDTFKQEFDRKNSFLKDWKLIIAGGSAVGRTNWVNELKDSARDYPIKVVENPLFGDIVNILGRSSIFWSAAGLGVDEQKEPQKVEHFGITVVEAMAAGCVPVVYNAGGFREIVDEGESGFTWTTEEQLLAKTEKLIGDKNLRDKTAKAAKEKSKLYSYERFEKEFLALL